MDPDLILIFSFILVVLLTILSFGTAAGKRDRRHRLEKLELQARIEEAKAAQVSKTDDERLHLEDRLRVLERIVTDPSTDLSRQIAALNELQPEGDRAS